MRAPVFSTLFAVVALPKEDNGHWPQQGSGGILPPLSLACKQFEMSLKIAVNWWYSAAAAPVLAPRSLNLRRCLIAQLNCAHKSRCIEKLQAVVGIVAVVVQGGAALQESEVGRRR